MSDGFLKVEAIQCAEAGGYYPAFGQRAVDWDCVAAWVERVRRPDFRWLPESELYDCGYIIVSVNLAIASGQHRVLAGLMAGNPVPRSSMSILTVSLRTQPWR